MRMQGGSGRCGLSIHKARTVGSKPAVSQEDVGLTACPLLAQLYRSGLRTLEEASFQAFCPEANFPLPTVWPEVSRDAHPQQEAVSTPPGLVNSTLQAGTLLTWSKKTRQRKCLMKMLF